MNITGTITNMEIMNTQQRIEQLEKELAELKSQSQFETGKWYRLSILDAICRYVGSGIGIGRDLGRWSEDVAMTKRDQWIEATPDEIKAALVKEAERRGFPCNKWKHPEFICPFFALDKGTDGWLYIPEIDELNFRCGTVYKQGKWAEPIEDQPDIVVNGYKAEFYEGYVKFGCAEIDNRFFTGMVDEKPWEFEGAGKGNRYVTAVKIGEGLFDVETINQICGRLR